ncbi:MAG: DUF4190 domain-containing protein [Spirochaetes bacterium]|nr:DUF4190 domain-containing protein [Spirochaetota bacterium]
MAVASLILGIVAIVFSFIPVVNFIGPIVGIVGIILGAVSMKNLKAAGQPTGMATGGLVTSIIGTVLSLLIWIACAACVGGASRAVQEAAKDPKFQRSFQDLQKAADELKRQQEQQNR